MKSTVTLLRGRRVLLVEDNAINRAIARSFLESASCEAEDAYNGAQALPARGAVRGPARKLTTNRNPSNKKYAVESSTAYFSFLETAYFAIAR